MADSDTEVKHDTVIVAFCGDCETTVEKESREEAEGVVEKHNEMRHDGDDVADVREEPTAEAMIEALRENMSTEELIDFAYQIGHESVRELYS